MATFADFPTVGGTGISCAHGPAVYPFCPSEMYTIHCIILGVIKSYEPWGESELEKEVGAC